jgi:hypothetical protein
MKVVWFGAVLPLLACSHGDPSADVAQQSQAVVASASPSSKAGSNAVDVPIALPGGSVDAPVRAPDKIPGPRFFEKGDQVPSELRAEKALAKERWATELRSKGPVKPPSASSEAVVQARALEQGAIAQQNAVRALPETDRNAAYDAWKRKATGAEK